MRAVPFSAEINISEQRMKITKLGSLHKIHAVIKYGKEI
jgi:hypothetical protein